MAENSPTSIVNELRGFTFFQGFPEPLLQTLATMSQPRRFQAGELILEQGKNNDTLFFLRSGKVIIQVDRENVSELSRPGEVFGEMSLINRKPVAANVRAFTDVETYALSESQLTRFPTADQERFQHLLHRVYASVLADRLAMTNEKAKKFEIANRDLAKTHDKLQKLNQQLESEIARRSSELVQKVKDLTQTHLQPVQAKLSKWVQSNLQQVPPNEIHEVFSSVAEVVDFLKPVADFAEKGKVTTSRRVLLYDTNKKQQQVARLALGGTGVELSLSSTAEEFEQKLKTENYDLLICEAEDPQALRKAEELKPDIPVAVLVQQNLENYLKTIESFEGQKFFISRDLENRLFTIKSIATTVSKILNNDLFGAEKYLAWGAKIIEKPVTQSEERGELIENMKQYFRSIGLRSSLLDRVHAASEELLMNAIYDAPVDIQGKSLFNHLPRTEKIELKPEHQGRFRYGTDGVFLAVSVSDPFGNLSKKVVTDYLRSCYGGQAGELNKEKGGAGRGLHMIIESSDLTIFNVKKKQRTEVICLFNLDRAQDDQVQPSFHLFMT